jgi:carbon-monoxide dehydrogenase medium subunit
MYPRAFAYHRASSLEEASTMLAQLGEGAKVLAGGQSLIPLMKLRLSSPAHVVDLNFVPGLSYVEEKGGELRLGALSSHSLIEHSAGARKIPILYDCASGIADVQVRNQGTIGGSLAEADPTGDWLPVLLTLDTTVICVRGTNPGQNHERKVPLQDFVSDAFTSVLAPDELVREIAVKFPTPKSGGAYLAFKRSAPVYSTASVAVQLRMEDGVVQSAAIALGAVGLVARRMHEAEAMLNGRPLSAKTLGAAAEAAMAACEPQSDLRGSAEHKRAVVGSLLKRATQIASLRSRGEVMEAGHLYA